MGLFKKVDGTENRFLRMGLYGRAGSGKTRTAFEVAIGLTRDLAGGAPIFMVDTEGNGVDHMAPICEAAGVELYAVKTRDILETIEALHEAEKAGGGVAIVDSVSHLWTELMDRYVKEAKSGTQFIEMGDWRPIKAAWRKFTDAYLSVQLHAIICGRAGAVYETQRNSRGRMESVAVDTKMRAEGEMEHEPSLLVEMVLEPRKDANGRRTGHVNVATVLKDRHDAINGARFEFPTYADFGPVIKRLAPHGEHVALHESQDAGRRLFGSMDWDSYRKKVRKEELVDRLSSLFALYDLAGSGKKEVKARAEVIQKHFGSPSVKEAFGNLELIQLERATENLQAELEQNSNPATADKEDDDLGF